MSRDRRLSSVLHGLLHLADAPGPVTSDVLARSMNTHAVAVRRELGRLRERGFVRSERGHGGGWTLARDLADISLREVYEALGAPALFAVQNKNQHTQCLLEQTVNDALDASFREAEALLLARLESVSLDLLAEDFRGRLEAMGLTEPMPKPTRRRRRAS